MDGAFYLQGDAGVWQPGWVDFDIKHPPTSLDLLRLTGLWLNGPGNGTNWWDLYFRVNSTQVPDRQHHPVKERHSILGESLATCSCSFRVPVWIMDCIQKYTNRLESRIGARTRENGEIHPEDVWDVRKGRRRRYESRDKKSDQAS